MDLAEEILRTGRQGSGKEETGDVEEGVVVCLHFLSETQQDHGPSVWQPWQQILLRGSDGGGKESSCDGCFSFDRHGETIAIVL